MIQAGALAYYNEDSGSIKPLKVANGRKSPMKDRVALLWGDEMYVIQVDGPTATVSAKGHHFQVPVKDLRDTPLLSVYQIDCGQGDAALVQFPDGRWMMVDAGPARVWSNSGKIAADFLYWKMFVDQSWKNEFGFRKGPFRLEAVVCTHPDFDHFGGFLDMTGKLKGAQRTLEFGTVYHNGMGRYSGAQATAYANGLGFGQLGPVEGAALPDAFLTALIDGFADVKSYSTPTATRPWTLSGEYGKWLKDLEALAGRGVGKLQRLEHGTGYLPGFKKKAGQCAVKVLGPYVESLNGKPALRYLDGDSKSSMSSPSLTRNGQSVVLRLDYGTVKILLTGDLNFKSHALLLTKVGKGPFKCDVAKACHHGSEDISWTFLKAMKPLATMFSSGDNESYAHPRARALGLAGQFGQARELGENSYLGFKEPRHVAPLIYSTELSRSIELYPAKAVYDSAGKLVTKPQLEGRARTNGNAGPRAPLKDWLLGRGLVYGLINVRTDGQRILMGALKETEDAFQVEVL